MKRWVERMLVAGAGASLALAVLAGLRGAVEAPGQREAAPGLAASVGRSGPLADLESLREELAAESIARATLAGEVEMMRAVIEQLVREAALPRVSAAGSKGPRASTSSEVAAHADSLVGQGQGVFDPAALLATGLAQREVDFLRTVWERKELARLDLADRATRGGWAFSPRHSRATRRIEAEARAEIGEDGYDRLLYATSQTNRVLVRDVLGGSAAERVGIEQGDQILSYDGRRMFKPLDLRQATAGGQRDEIVRVEVQRGPRTLLLTIPRGPMGILMLARSLAPRGS
jgi:membrane-associated protease RseP (regulator of RpoE activity)